MEVLLAGFSLWAQAEWLGSYPFYLALIFMLFSLVAD